MFKRLQLILVLALLLVVCGCATKNNHRHRPAVVPAAERAYTLELAEGWRELSYEEANNTQYNLTTNGFGDFNAAYTSAAPSEDVMPHIIVMSQKLTPSAPRYDLQASKKEVAKMKKWLANASWVYSYSFLEGVYAEDKTMTYIKFEMNEVEGHHLVQVGFHYTDDTRYFVGAMAAPGDSKTIEQIKEMIYAFQPTQ